MNIKSMSRSMKKVKNLTDLKFQIVYPCKLHKFVTPWLYVSGQAPVADHQSTPQPLSHKLAPEYKFRHYEIMLFCIFAHYNLL